MSVLCSAPPWGPSCLQGLGLAIEMGSNEGIALWMELHMDGSEKAAVLFTGYVAGLVSSRFQAQIDAMVGRSTSRMFVPEGLDGAGPTHRDVGMLVTLLANEDAAGFTGYVQGIRGRDDDASLAEVWGELLALAHGVLAASGPLPGVRIERRGW